MIDFRHAKDWLLEDVSLRQAAGDVIFGAANNVRAAAGHAAASTTTGVKAVAAGALTTAEVTVKAAMLAQLAAIIAITAVLPILCLGALYGTLNAADKALRHLFRHPIR